MRHQIFWFWFSLIFVYTCSVALSSQNCMINFRSIGDSHADTPQIEALKNVPSQRKNHFQAFSYSIHGKLMFSVGRDGLDMATVLKTAKVISIRPWNNNERRKKYFNLKIPGVAYCSAVRSSPLTDKDILYFIFGEIDARHKLSDMFQRGWYRDNIDAGINDLVFKYIESIKNSLIGLPTKTVWIGGLPPQPKFTENINNWSPVTGSLEQRQKYAKLINQRLQLHCEKEGYIFMDFSEGYSTPEGDLDMSFTDGNHHLNFWTERTKDKFAEKLMQHYENVCPE